MTTRQRIFRIIGALILAYLALQFFTSCNPKLCPTYDGALRAKKQAKIEKSGGETGLCAYRPDVTKKEKKRASKIWHSDFCYVKKKKWKR